jgi:hypothetical protein
MQRGTASLVLSVSAGTGVAGSTPAFLTWCHRFSSGDSLSRWMLWSGQYECFSRVRANIGCAQAAKKLLAGLQFTLSCVNSGSFVGS